MVRDNAETSRANRGPQAVLRVHEAVYRLDRRKLFANASGGQAG